MKILHTADWHIGINWKTVDRSDDLLERAVPDIVQIAIKEKIDLLLIAGDIFERQSHETLEKAAETLQKSFKELLTANIDIALLPGNHDSLPLFKFLRSAIELVSPPSTTQGQIHILNSAWIKTIKNLQIIHLPYLRSEQIEAILKTNPTPLLNSIAMTNLNLSGKLDQIATTLRDELNPNKPALLAYHGLVQGSKTGTDEQYHEFTYRDDFMLSPDSLLFNDQVPNYNALGHIHKCQQLSAPIPTWYSGSIDRLDRGEKNYTPTVLLINFPPNAQRIEHEEHPLPRPTPFIDEHIKNETELNTLSQTLGTTQCNLALGKITLTCDPIDAFKLEQQVRDTFPRLKNIKEAVLRPRSTTSEINKLATLNNIKTLTNPATTIRTYINQQMPKNRQQGLLNALKTVEEELNL